MPFMFPTFSRRWKGEIVMRKMFVIGAIGLIAAAAIALLVRNRRR